MTRLDKCKLAKELGYTYNPETGQVFGKRGKEIVRQWKGGHIMMNCNYEQKQFNLYAHHFAWYLTYGNVDFELLDHINEIPNDNRICNLRIATKQQNRFNCFTSTKGYYKSKRSGKYYALIMLNGENKHLGYYKTEEEAKQAYLLAKEKYHII